MNVWSRFETLRTQLFRKRILIIFLLWKWIKCIFVLFVLTICIKKMPGVKSIAMKSIRKLYSLHKEILGEGGWFVIFRLCKSILFCQLNFIVLFPFLIKYYHILIIIVFWLGCDRPSGLLLFVPAVLFSILKPLFCVSSSVSLSYFVLAVPMHKCLGKHSCISSPCPIATLNGTFLFRKAK